MTPDEWDANGVPGKYAATLNQLAELVFSLNKMIHCAQENEKLSLLPSVDSENFLRVSVRWQESADFGWTIGPKRAESTPELPHPTIELTDPYGDAVQIDCEIAPLMRWLWDQGMETFNSCQDNHGYVWIEFNWESAQRFLDHIMQHGDEILQTRADPIDIWPRHKSELVAYDAWEDNWLIGACADYDEDFGMVITISIRFPREHLTRVMATIGQGLLEAMNNN